MASIRGKDTSPELRLRKALHHAGLRYKINVKELPGKPDIVLPRHRAIIFVNGCFWHGHSCQQGRVPATNSDFWRNKVSTNRRRDAKNIKQLRSSGWKVLIVWECAISTKAGLIETTELLKARLSPAIPKRID